MEKLGEIDKSKKVWVGGLPEKATWKDLFNLFKDEAKPQLTHILNPKKGTACVAFKSDDDAEKAIATFNGAEIKGQAIEVDVWTQKEKAEGTKGKRQRNKKSKNVEGKTNNATTKAVIKSKFVKKVVASNKGKVKKQLTPAEEKMKEKLKEIDPAQKVWVGGLSDKTTFKMLKKHFSEHDCQAKLVSIKNGKACVTFDTADEATNAIGSLNATTVDGKVIEVDVWTKPERKEKKGKKDKDTDKTD